MKVHSASDLAALAQEGTVASRICFIKHGICQLKKILSVAFTNKDGKKVSCKYAKLFNIIKYKSNNMSLIMENMNITRHCRCYSKKEFRIVCLIKSLLKQGIV